MKGIGASLRTTENAFVQTKRKLLNEFDLWCTVSLPPMEQFDEFFKLLPKRAVSQRSWSVPAEELKARNYDLKAVNPNRKQTKVLTTKQIKPRGVQT